MKKSDIYETAIKILGLYLVVIIIEQLREVFMYAVILMQPRNPDNFGGLNQTPLFIVIIISFLILVAFAGLLLFRTKRLTRMICKKDDFEETTHLFADKKTIYEIALTLTGLIILTWTLPDFVFQLKNHIKLLNSNFPGNGIDTGFLYIAGLKILIGFLAIIYSKTISTYLAIHKTQ